MVATQATGVFHSFGTKFRIVSEPRKWMVSSHQACRLHDLGMVGRMVDGE